MDSPTAQLCQACGLCCDGTLFASAPLSAKEALKAPGLKLRVIQRPDGSSRLAQPCAALDGTRCTVYADRPSVCREYHCDLVNALGENVLSLDEALQIVAKVKAQSAVVEAGLPPDPERDPKLVHPRLAAWRMHEPDEGKALPIDLFVELQRLEELLVHSFLGRRGR